MKQLDHRYFLSNKTRGYEQNKGFDYITVSRYLDKYHYLQENHQARGEIVLQYFWYILQICFWKRNQKPSTFRLPLTKKYQKLENSTDLKTM